MDCFIDDREQKRVQPAYNFFTDVGFNTEIKELSIGDYVFIDNGISVAFEYKTIDDYIHSLKDYRVFNQAINQSNNFDYHFVIIVGTEYERLKAIKSNKQYTGRYMSLKEFYGSIGSIVNYSSIIQVDNQNHAFICMQVVAEHCTSLKPVLKRFPKSRGTPALRLLANNVEKVGDKTAEKICDTLGLRTIDDVLGLDKSDLVSVDGIGDKIADMILEQLKDI